MAELSLFTPGKEITLHPPTCHLFHLKTEFGRWQSPLNLGCQRLQSGRLKRWWTPPSSQYMPLLLHERLFQSAHPVWSAVAFHGRGCIKMMPETEKLFLFVSLSLFALNCSLCCFFCFLLFCFVLFWGFFWEGEYRFLALSGLFRHKLGIVFHWLTRKLSKTWSLHCCISSTHNDQTVYNSWYRSSPCIKYNLFKKYI